MNEPLRISYRLVGTGWSACTVQAGDARAELSASYVSDALGKLVLSAVAVGSGFRAVSFGFDEEPGEYRWVVEAEQNNLMRLRILEFQELWGHEPNDKGRCMFEFVTTPLVYAKAVAACAADVLQTYGLDGYNDKWASEPFPEPELVLLERVVERWQQ